MIDKLPLRAPRAAISVDLDPLRCYRDIHGLRQEESANSGKNPDPAYTVGVERLLELFEACAIPATLFVIGKDLNVPVHRQILEKAHRAGHELANHSYSHHYDLRHRHFLEQRDEILRADEAIAEISGRRPVGFRAPGYNITKDLLEICYEAGYHYDASIFPSPPYYLAKAAIMAWMRLRKRPSRSAIGPITNLFAPLTPYRLRTSAAKSSRDSSAKEPAPDVVQGAFWEIPVAVLPWSRFPLIGTSLHLPGIRGFEAIFPTLVKTYPCLFNLEFHAIDFMDSNDPGVEDLLKIQPDLAIPWKEKRALYVHIFKRLRDVYLFAPLHEAVKTLEAVGTRRA